MVRASIGCMLMGDRGLYWKLTGRENLDYFGLYHVPREIRRKRIEDLISLLKLSDFVDRTVETYSAGQRMILAFAKALVNDAPILILDEPTVTMDCDGPGAPTHRQGAEPPRQNNRLHDPPDARGRGTLRRVAIIDHGAIIALARLPDLKASISTEDIVELEGIFPEGAWSGCAGCPHQERDGHLQRFRLTKLLGVG